MIRVLPLVLIAGCATAPQSPPHIDAALLEPCPIAEPSRYTTAETIRVANARKTALVQCNRDKERIRDRLQ
jgi:hypothetical protein